MRQVHCDLGLGRADVERGIDATGTCEERREAGERAGYHSQGSRRQITGLEEARRGLAKVPQSPPARKEGQGAADALGGVEGSDGHPYGLSARVRLPTHKNEDAG